MTARLDRIDLYPVKSLDGVAVESARVRGGGGLVGDREYRLVDAAEGAVLNGKKLGAALIRLRAELDLDAARVALVDGAASIEADLPDQIPALEGWLSARLERAVRIERGDGFADDEDASGPTVVSRATLREVGSWFGLDEDEMRRRIRANLIVDGVPAFWEDRLYGREGEPRWFRVGGVRLEAVNPCARCAVPSRDSRTGEIADARFAKIFSERRRETLPEWADASRFDHYYRLAVNTRAPADEDGKTLSAGQEVTL